MPSNGVRLIHGESDGLPGLIVDRYADTLCAQFLSAGIERWKATHCRLPAEGHRPDATVRTQRRRACARSKACSPSTGWLRGDGPTEVEIREHGWRFHVDVAKGHKTGFYLDQRDNRKPLRRHAVRHFGFQRVLNCFCYTGGFSVAALGAAARPR